jgi:mycothiol synthase
MSEKQLKMIRPNLDDLPEVEIPEGYELRTYRPGDEAAWAEIISTGLGTATADDCREKLTSKPQFLPFGLFFATFDGKPVGSACAWRESEDEWLKGYVHMVCVLPEHRGKHLGYWLTLAVLRFFRDQGFREAFLDTNDWRLPAIKSYLNLGFEPHYFDDSHRKRWQKVFEELRITQP